jgi:hypothetical protein
MVVGYSQLMEERCVRGRSIWRHRQTGEQVRVYLKRKITYEPISFDLVHYLVLFTDLDIQTLGVMHEVDFRKEYEWVSGK